MTLEQLNRTLGEATKAFYMHKISTLDNMSPEKKVFMLAVLKLLVEDPYLREKMRELGKVLIAI
jgi:anaerobic magnesium-protoporphyrin IX monomethyl ester cyclase